MANFCATVIILRLTKKSQILTAPRSIIFWNIGCESQIFKSYWKATTYITYYNTNCTVGTDLISMLEINVSGKTLQISSASTMPLGEDIVTQFPDLTAPAQGTFQAFKHIITFTNNAKPQVTKQRITPFDQ